MSFSGEVVFNTGMTGYHEILTDPSYTGQIVLMTCPHIGNYGNQDEWSESGPKNGRPQARGVHAQGLVLRSVYRGTVPEGRIGIGEFLIRHGLCGISEVDTRGLTLSIRRGGSRNGIIIAPSSPGGLGEAEFHLAREFLQDMPGMVSRNLAGEVGVREVEIINAEGAPHVALLDCGVKMNIIRRLVHRGCRITLLPSGSNAAAVRTVAPDALLFSNGPGDPAPLEAQAELAKHLMGELPLWGICLGLQILARAVGGSTGKMRFGHHGLNHPVRDEKTGRVFVTSQNHGFAVNENDLPDICRVRFRNTNDGSIEGIESRELKLLAVQYHPEAAPGPIDSDWVFDAFLETL